MPDLCQWNEMVDNLKNFSSLVSQKVVQIILVLKKTNISSKWRFFRLRLSLIVEHNDTRSVSLYDITVTSYECHGVWLTGILIVYSTAC